MKEVKLEDVTDEVRKLAVSWGDAYHMDTIATMQLGMQIQYVCNVNARLQIEKDRERIKDNFGLDGIMMGFTNSIIDQTPVILD